MSKRSHFRTPFDCQHVEGSQTLLKSVRLHFYHIISSFWEKLSWKMCFLMIFEILGLFLNILIAGDRYSLLMRRRFRNQFKPNYLRNKSFFLICLLHLWNLHQILNILKYKMRTCTREILAQPIQMQLSKKQNVFTEFLKPTSNLWHFEKNDEPHSLSISEIKDWKKRGQVKCLKSPLSEHPATVVMLKSRKHCWNLQDIVFIILFHHSEKN